MVCDRNFFKSVFCPGGRFERTPFICGVATFVLVLLVPFVFDCMHFFYNENKDGVGFCSFLLIYINNCACYVWLANSYFLVVLDFCGFLKICGSTKAYEELDLKRCQTTCDIVRKILLGMTAAVSTAIVVALAAGVCVIFHLVVFRLCVAIIAYGSFFLVLIALLGCKLVKTHTIHRLERPIKDTYGGLNAA